MKSSISKPFIGVDLGKPDTDKTITALFVDGELKQIIPHNCSDCGYPIGLVQKCHICQLKKCFDA